MCPFSYRHSRIFFSHRLKWAVWAILVTFSLSAYGASPEPLVVINPFVPLEVLRKVQGIEVVGKPVLVLNPYVKPLDLMENAPYQRIIPSPQVVFPASTLF